MRAIFVRWCLPVGSREDASFFSAVFLQLVRNENVNDPGDAGVGFIRTVNEVDPFIVKIEIFSHFGHECRLGLQKFFKTQTIYDKKCPISQDILNHVK